MELIFTDEKINNFQEELIKVNLYIEAKEKTKAALLLNKIINSIIYNKDILQTFAALLYEILIETKLNEVLYEKSIDSFITILNNEPFDIKAKESIEIVISKFYNLIDRQVSIQILHKVLEVIPNSSICNSYIGILYNSIEKSLYYYKLALELNEGNNIIIYNNIYILLFNNDKFELALEYMKHALLYYKDDPNINLYLATLYTKLGEKELPLALFKIAINNYNKSIISDHKSLLSLIYSNFAFYYMKLPNFDLARKYANMSHEILPSTNTLSCFLMNLNYEINKDKMYNTNEHMKINNYFTRCKPYIFDKNFYNTDKINIGIVSGDLTIQHAVNYFISTFINKYNKDKFTLTCYSDNEHGNCKRLKNMTSKEGSDLIYNDKIHILIDLHGHTTYNRLDIFANKPSPIQITWIGYPFTTGLNEMDYRITDRICDNDNSQIYYSETLLFLNNCFLCFNPRFLPTIVKEHRTKLVIGCFNRPNKMSDEFIEMCNQILKCYPEVELKFNSEAFSDKDIFSEFLTKFKHIDRISNIISPRLINEHLLTYNQIDVCLDTFPYSGTTTTCECLQMGVPVLTIYNPNNFHVSNVTASILKNSQLDFFICDNKEDLISKLNNLSVDKEQIRRQFLDGKVCDQELHVKNLEEMLVDLYNKHKITEKLITDKFESYVSNEYTYCENNNKEIKILNLILYSEESIYCEMYSILSSFLKSQKVDHYFYCFRNDESFFEGENSKIIGDIIFFRGIDSYIYGILDKTFKVFDMFKNSNYDFIVRTNISSIINFDLLIEYLKSNYMDYGGSLSHSGSFVDIPAGLTIEKNKLYGNIPYIGGSCIILSIKFISKLLTDKDIIMGYCVVDDVAIGVYFETKCKELIKGKLNYDSCLFDAEKYDEKCILYRNKKQDRNIDIFFMQKITCEMLKTKHTSVKMIVPKVNRIAFITSIYGNYEAECKRFKEQLIGTDFICFTNNENIKSNGWIIDTNPYHLTNPCDFDNGSYVNSINNNRHTFNISKFYKQCFINIPRLSQYDKIVWLDGTIEITSQYVSTYIINSKELITTMDHEDRFGILSNEFKDSFFDKYTLTYWLGQSQPIQDIKLHFDTYEIDGYTDEYWKLLKRGKHYGVFVTCFIIFDIKNEYVRKLLNFWYLQTLMFTTQDQISFPYACQKLKLNPNSLISNKVKGNYNKNDFYTKHNHGTKIELSTNDKLEIINNNEISFDDINSFPLDENKLLFFDIYHKDNQIILICPVYEDIDPSEFISNIKISNNGIPLNLDGFQSKIEYEPILIIGYKFTSSNKINMIKVEFNGIIKEFNLKCEDLIDLHKLSITTLFKDDFKLIDLFYSYYDSQGVKKFYLYYNGILTTEIKELFSKKGVKLIEWNFKYWNSTSNTNFLHHAQMGQIHHALWKYGKNRSEYMIFCDFDEYLTVDNKTLINEIKEKKYDFFGFCTQWCLVEEIPKTLPFNFTKSEIIPYPSRSKCIYKVSLINTIGIHYSNENLNGKSDYIMYHFLNFSNIKRIIAPKN